MERRERLVGLARRWDVVILEDAVCSELELTSPAPPALRSLSDQIIHCSSFSKGMLPGIRLGYVAGRPDLIDRLALLKQANDLISPGLLQRALGRLLDGGRWAPHLHQVNGGLSPEEMQAESSASAWGARSFW